MVEVSKVLGSHPELADCSGLECHEGLQLNVNVNQQHGCVEERYLRAAWC